MKQRFVPMFYGIRKSAAKEDSYGSTIDKPGGALKNGEKTRDVGTARDAFNKLSKQVADLRGEPYSSPAPYLPPFAENADLIRKQITDLDELAALKAASKGWYKGAGASVGGLTGGGIGMLTRNKERSALQQALYVGALSLLGAGAGYGAGAWMSKRGSAPTSDDVAYVHNPAGKTRR